MADRETPSDAGEQSALARALPARLGETIMALALFVTALFFVWHAVLLPFGRVGLPGPGFFPFALGIALGLLALVTLARTLRSPAGGVIFIGHESVAVVLAALIGVAFAFERADTYLLLGTFAGVLLLFVARAAPWRAALGAALGMVAVWLVFRLALGVRLPAGEFWPQISGLMF